jgi:hypothetical protein
MNNKVQALIGKKAKKFVEDFRKLEITTIEDGGFIVSRPHGFTDFVDEDKADEWLAERLTQELNQLVEEEREFLKRLDLDFKVICCECGEEWKGTDPHNLVKERIKSLKQKEEV